MHVDAKVKAASTAVPSPQTIIYQVFTHSMLACSLVSLLRFALRPFVRCTDLLTTLFALRWGTQQKLHANFANKAGFGSTGRSSTVVQVLFVAVCDSGRIVTYNETYQRLTV